MLRISRFLVVGVLGTGVQLAALVALSSVLPRADMVVTALGVEAAVLHNFVWHWQWTWRERRVPSWRVVLTAFARFHLATATCSIAGNVLIAVALARWFGWPLVFGNLAAIVVCAAANFALADRLVFVASGGMATHHGGSGLATAARR